LGATFLGVVISGLPCLCPYLLFSLLQRFGAVLEALEKGQPVDMSALPPAPEGLYGQLEVSAQAGVGRISGVGLARHFAYTSALGSQI
jgi:hypothetical protein